MCMEATPAGNHTNSPDYNLTGLIYDAVLNASLWPQLLEKMASHLNMPPSINGVISGHSHDVLSDHFKRAVQIQQKISEQETLSDAFSRILNQLPIGIILVHRDASVVASNQLADDILKKTGHLLIQQGRLQINSTTHTKELHKLIRKSFFSEQAEPITISIGQAGEETSIWVTASGSHHADLHHADLHNTDLHNTDLHNTGMLAAVFIHSPHLQHKIPLAAFAAKYQLSRAETQLAETLLSDCHTLNNAAEHLGVSKHTVRAQIKSIFSKTGCSSQVELIKKILTSPSTLIYAQRKSDRLTEYKKYRDGDDRCMRLYDGRKLAWKEFGNHEGKPVIVFHSLTGTHPDYSLAKAMGIRLIVPERPGSYGSDPLPDRSFMDWPGDVKQLLNHLALDTVSIVSFSAGTPYALACAAKIPEHIDNMVLVNCMAPIRSLQDLDGMLPLNRTAMSLAYQSPTLFIDFMRVFLDDLKQDSASYFRNISEHQPSNDIAILADQSVQEHFMRSFQTAAKENFQQLCEEISLCASNWPIELSHYNKPVSIWHGTADPLVPLPMGQRIAEQLRKPVTHFIEGEGNYLIFNYWQAILTELVSHH